MVTHVLVLGGGYAGVMAANRLAGRDDVAVTLVNPRPQFVERVRLHQLVAGTHDAVHDYGEVLNERVQVVVGEAASVDVARRRVVLVTGEDVAYDYLVYAVGSHGSQTQVPGAVEHALPVSTFEAATRLRAALAAAPLAPVVVVGGGPTGIETAAELAETGRTVTLVCGGVLAPYVRPRARRSIGRRLARLSVTVLERRRATEVRDGSVVLDDGTDLAGLVVWATGFQASDLARDSGLTVDADGRLLTDETLTSVDDERVVAAGDAAAPSGAPLRASCQAAEPLGAAAAAAVLARIDGRSPAPIANVFVGQCLSLGRHDGIFQAARPDDTAVPVHVPGRAGALLKEQVTRQTVHTLTGEARRPGSAWLPSSRSARSRALRRAGVSSASSQVKVGA